MFRKRLAAVFMPLFVVTIGGAAFADPVPAKPDTSEKAPSPKAKLNETFSVLHAVGPWSIKISEMADKKAKSDLVKSYAQEVATANTKLDAKLMSVAKEGAIEVTPLDPQTEEGKSVLDRIKGETVLLESLEGDAFDKEYMTLVTNTQQSVIHVLDTSKPLAKDQGTKQFIGEVSTTVQKRLKTAQDVMTKVYGDKI